MNSAELKHLLLQVITSWQVIFVTVALVLYLFLVFYVAKVRRRKRPSAYAITGNAAPKASKTPPTEMAEGDDLGLEEQA
ncbi:hypothetical protein AGMMS49928_11490 [Spirochaetia bacterium]|nr:hypothetical protein AGMMS49928_11490 [Spirochaetia bacterium]